MKSDQDQAQPVLRFQLLGAVRAQRHGHPLELGSPQQLAVLARLLLNAGRSVSVPDLVDGIWGDEPPPRAVGTVRTYVSRLRASMEPDRPTRSPARVLLSTGDGYTLRVHPDALDLHVFERHLAEAERQRADGDSPRALESLTSALALWDGGVLAGVPGGYAAGQRRRLGELRLSAVEASLSVELELGLLAPAIATLGPLTAEFPLREELRGLLMLALYRSGRQAEALGVYADTRRLLVDELGVEPGPRLASLHHGILAADPALSPPAVAQTAATGPPGHPGPPGLRVPTQLPPDILDFSGRDKLVAEIADALRAATGHAVAICALSGIGGVGKTTLAVHSAHEVRGAFPDGQLYMDLCGAGPSPLDPAAVLAEFLQILGTPPEQLPETTEQRTALFRSLLADRRVLVLLDNIRDAAQVRPLLPSTGGSSVLVTSRSRLASLPGAQLVDVEAFSEDEAVDLFAAIAGAERVGAEERTARDVVRACTLLPLAVRIVASRLASRPAWTMASLARRLDDQRRRLDELQVGDLAVEATFQLGYLQLNEQQARAFRLLALPEGPVISLAAAAVLLELPEPDAEAVVESLVDAGLLEADEPGRYRYHDLLRIFARRRSEEIDPDPVRQQALLRLLDHFLASVCNASRTLESDDTLSWRLHTPIGAGEPLADPDSAWSWLTSERPQLLAVVEQVVRTAPSALRAVTDLLLGWIWLVEGQARVEDFLSVLRPAVDLAAARGDTRSEARLRYLVGLLHGIVGNGSLAEDALRRSLALVDAEESLEIHYTVASELAVLLNGAGRSEEALPYLELAQRLCAELGHQADGARLLANIARAHLSSGRRPEAVAAAREAVSTAGVARNPTSLADALYQLGTVLHGCEQHAEAAQRLGEALDLFAGQQRPSMEAYALARLAECHIDLGNPGEAVSSAEKALELGREVGARYGQGLAQAALGRALVALGQSERGRRCLTEAQRLFDELEVAEAAAVRTLLRCLPEVASA
ncbi:DNA-binding SARP family transcriptional activator [Streptacidiphilus sp. MAP12-16]|uniref:AfsR/SARP family transcriptional regulator n=1 Tax=Streptacidiphilus sp. MAP12-16 TaxID=3156300 RepID=UPI003512ED5F